MKKIIPFIILNTLIACGTLSAQSGKSNQSISLEEIWQKGIFYAKGVHGINWMKDGKYYSSLEKNSIVKNNVATGKSAGTIVDETNLIIEGKETPIKINSYSFSSDQSQVLIQTNVERIYRHSSKAQFYVYNIKSKSLNLLSEGAKIMFASFSPDGKKIAYVKDNDLYYTNMISMKEVRITSDGEWGKIINGWADWVYEEEFGKAVAFSWSPDGKKIAYYRFDESNVREYNMQLWGELYPKDYRFKYPKAGEDNSEVSVYCYDVMNQKSTLLEDGKGKDQYLPRIFWTNSAKELLIFKLNRLQNHLQILKTNTSSGAQKKIYEEQNNTYVEIYDDIHFIEGKDQFILASERDGYKHLYLYDFDGTLINQITKGKWDVAGLVGVDNKKGTVYYTSATLSAMDRQLYAVNMDGTSTIRLTTGNGTHRINMSPDTRYFIDSYSKLNTPSLVTLYKTAGNKSMKILEDNAVLKDLLKERASSTQEFFSFKTSEDIELNGWMMKPPGFDASKKYPVLMYVYGGPGSQTVTDSWGGSNYIWYQMLAQKGYVVVSIDNRGTGYRGAEFKKMTYGQLGKYETMDQIEGAKYLGTLPFVDKSRIGIWGWSFGGYMTSLCLTLGADVFKTGVAVAPVTSWRFYDSIYTERFLGLPKDNKSGYDDNSPLSHTDKLEGNYFIIHGTADDNVHFQNAIEMEDALVKSNKQFRSFYYPNKNHSIYGGVTRLHLYTMMTDYILKNL